MRIHKSIFYGFSTRNNLFINILFFIQDSDGKPPRSMVGNLLRFKGDVANNIGEMSDRVSAYELNLYF